jgi:hypothetical protein
MLRLVWDAMPLPSISSSSIAEFFPILIFAESEFLQLLACAAAMEIRRRGASDSPPPVNAALPFTYVTRTGRESVVTIVKLGSRSNPTARTAEPSRVSMPTSAVCNIRMQLMGSLPGCLLLCNCFAKRRKIT